MATMKKINRIHINDIPNQGLKIHSDSKSAEFNALFVELLGGPCKYSMDIELREITDETFQLLGKIELEKDESCSRCDLAFPLRILHKYNDVILREEPLDNEMASRTLSGSDQEAPNTSDEWFYTGEEIDLEQILRESVGLDVPLAPAPALDKASNCGFCGKNCPPIVYDDTPEFKESPFSKLKLLKQ